MAASKGFQQMSARRVAEIGYDAMMRGKAVAVAGWKNELMVAVSRRTPVMWAARAAARVNKDR